MVSMVVNTKPGTTVPLVIYRKKQRQSLSVTVDELDLEAEQSPVRAAGDAERPRGAARADRLRDDARADHAGARAAARAGRPTPGGAVVSDVQRNSPAAKGGVLPGGRHSRSELAEGCEHEPGQPRAAESAERPGRLPAGVARRQQSVRHHDEALGRTGDCRTYTAGSRYPRCAALALVCVVPKRGMLAKIEPFWSWHTPIAWTGYIFFIDGLEFWRRRGESPIRNDRAENRLPGACERAALGHLRGIQQVQRCPTGITSDSLRRCSSATSATAGRSRRSGRPS